MPSKLTVCCLLASATASADKCHSKIRTSSPTLAPASLRPSIGGAAISFPTSVPTAPPAILEITDSENSNPRPMPTTTTTTTTSQVPNLDETAESALPSEFPSQQPTLLIDTEIFPPNVNENDTTTTTASAGATTSTVRPQVPLPQIGTSPSDTPSQSSSFQTTMLIDTEIFSPEVNDGDKPGITATTIGSTIPSDVPSDMPSDIPSFVENNNDDDVPNADILAGNPVLQATSSVVGTTILPAILIAISALGLVSFSAASLF